MFGLLIVLTIILVLILINKNTKSSPESAGCVEQGCAFLVIMFVIAFVVPDCARRQQARYEYERTTDRSSGVAPPSPSVTFTDVTIADAANPSVHATSLGATTSKITIDCRVSGASPGMPLTGKWFLLGSGTRQHLQEATVYATQVNQPLYFSVARPSDKPWPVGTYEVELWANGVLCQTVTFWVNP